MDRLLLRRLLRRRELVLYWADLRHAGAGPAHHRLRARAKAVPGAGDHPDSGLDRGPGRLLLVPGRGDHGAAGGIRVRYRPGDRHRSGGSDRHPHRRHHLEPRIRDRLGALRWVDFGAPRRVLTWVMGDRGPMDGTPWVCPTPSWEAS